MFQRFTVDWPFYGFVWYFQMTPTHTDSENGLEDHGVQSDYKSSVDGDESPRVPLILIDGPGGGLHKP